MFCVIHYMWKYNYCMCFSLEYASLCSLGDWFETRFVGNAKGRLSWDEAYIVVNIHLN